MELLSKFGSDLEKANEGVWIDLIDTEGQHGSIRICRMWNPRFKEAFRKYTDEIQAKKERMPNDEESDDLMIKCIAETILIDWKDIKVAGEIFLYSVENAVKLLSNPQLQDFRDRVVVEANMFSNYRIENLENISLK